MDQRDLVEEPVGLESDDRRRGHGLRAAPEIVPVTGWLPQYLRVVVAVDAAAVALSAGAALLVRFGAGGVHLGNVPYVVVAAAVSLGWVGSLAIGRAYDARALGVGAEEYKRVLSVSFRVFAAVAIVSYVGKLELARGFVAVAFPLGGALLLIGRRICRGWLSRQRRSVGWSHRVLVAGARDHVMDLVVQLRRHPDAGYHVVGACLPPGAPAYRTEDDLPVLGDLHDVARVAREIHADTVAVTASQQLGSRTLRRLGWDLEGTGISLVVAPALTDVAGPRIHVRPVAGLPLLHVEEPELPRGGQLLKESLDRVAAVLGLVLLSPLLVAIAVAVRLDSPGPAVFRQVRTGRRGREFTVWKFRSMHVDAEDRLVALRAANEGSGLLFKMRSDPRVTAVGRFLRRYSLDELPQLVNVARGDMSLVGPRPPLPEEVALYASDVSRRLLVKPGVTGLWQVNGRSDLPWDEAVRLDLYYVENWSFALDLLILWRTVSAVFAARGAY